MTSIPTTSEATAAVATKCWHCGGLHRDDMVCPRVMAVEHKPDGTVRYEYWPIGAPPQETTH